MLQSVQNQMLYFVDNVDIVKEVGNEWCPTKGCNAAEIVKEKLPIQVVYQWGSQCLTLLSFFQLALAGVLS